MALLQHQVLRAPKMGMSNQSKHVARVSSANKKCSHKRALLHRPGMFEAASQLLSS
jgi:hypothetical protein